MPNDSADTAMPNATPGDQLDLFGSAPADATEAPTSALLRADLIGNVDAPEPVPADKRLTGEKHIQTTLMWLHRFSWLTSRMLAALTFSTASQSWPLARRLLKKMLADKLILVRPLPQGGDAYLLSAKGARLLNETTGVNASSGQNLAIANAQHRACGNWYLISQLQAGLEVFTEHEIASGRAPFQTVNGKQFDAAVVHALEDNGTRLVSVCEIEHASKNRQRRQAICDSATRHLGRNTLTRLGTDATGADLYLARLVIVATGVDSLRSMVATFLEAHRLLIASEACLASVDVAVLPVSPSLVAGEITTGNLWWDVVRPYSLA
jgi:hypothetical protein